MTGTSAAQLARADENFGVFRMICLSSRATAGAPVHAFDVHQLQSKADASAIPVIQKSN